MQRVHLWRALFLWSFFTKMKLLRCLDVLYPIYQSRVPFQLIKGVVVLNTFSLALTSSNIFRLTLWSIFKQAENRHSKQGKDILSSNHQVRCSGYKSGVPNPKGGQASAVILGLWPEKCYWMVMSQEVWGLPLEVWLNLTLKDSIRESFVWETLFVEYSLKRGVEEGILSQFRNHSF